MTAIDAPGCPFHGRTMPTDGTPLAPSPTLGRWRDEAPATPLVYPDGHHGLIVTRYELARDVLADPRFSLATPRFPLSSGGAEDPLDERAVESIRVSSILSVDGEQHLRLRRAILPRFSLRAVRQRREAIDAIVARRLDDFLARERPADLFAHYATPISNAVHRLVLGVPDELGARYDELFAGSSSTQHKFDFLRTVIDAKRVDPGDDVVSHLLAGEYTEHEVEGLVFTVMASGRDSVAYLISTAMVALLSDRSQLELLRGEPERMPSAVEEFMRVGAMFVTLFPRTATEDLELDGVRVAAGQTVAVSPVAANHDERRYEDPERFDIARDASGHLGFSHGPHGCIGQQLARVEIAEAIGQLLAAAPGLALVGADQLEPGSFASHLPTYEAGAVHVTW